MPKALAAVISLLTATAPCGGQRVTTNIPLEGSANGGFICFADANFSPSQACVKTIPGQPASTVAHNLAAEINNVFPDWDARSTSDSIKVPGDNIMNVICGSETGLGTIKPPTSLAAIYNKETSAFIAQWENGTDYDQLIVKCNVDRTILSGNQTSVTLSLNPDRYRKPINLIVQGFQGSMPSSVASLEVDNNKSTESGGHLGYGGLQSNWNLYGNSERVFPDIKIIGSFPKNNRLFRCVEDKPFYQVVKCHTSDTTGGLVRRIPQVGLVKVKSLSLYVSRNLAKAIEHKAVVLSACTADRSQPFIPTGLSARQGQFEQFTCDTAQLPAGEIKILLLIPPGSDEAEYAIDWLVIEAG